jgi:hypothetical protein
MQGFTISKVYGYGLFTRTKTERKKKEKKEEKEERKYIKEVLLINCSSPC